VIHIEVEESEVRAGGVVKGRVVLTPSEDQAARRVELAVLWETEGKGNTDLGVAYFAVLADGDRDAARRTHTFAAQLPLAPLTYEGRTLRIRWLVRVKRLARLGGDDEVVDATFRVRSIG
jgi:hypothetical protein